MGEISVPCRMNYSVLVWGSAESIFMNGPVKQHTLEMEGQLPAVSMLKKVMRSRSMIGLMRRLES